MNKKLGCALKVIVILAAIVVTGIAIIRNECYKAAKDVPEHDYDAESTAILCANDIKSKPAPPKIPKMLLASKIPMPVK